MLVLKLQMRLDLILQNPVLRRIDERLLGLDELKSILKHILELSWFLRMKDLNLGKLDRFLELGDLRMGVQKWAG